MTGLNLLAVRAIYRFEMARFGRTLMQSLISPVISTALYFVVFGAAIGERMQDVGGVPYGAFIVPGLIMLSLLTQSIANASFGIYFPKFTGTIYELLSAPVSYVEITLAYVGAAASKSVILGLVILATAAVIVPLQIEHPFWMLSFLVLTAVTFSLAAHVSWRQLLLHRHAAAGVADRVAVQSGGVPDQRVSLELSWNQRRFHRREPGNDAGLPDRVPRHRGVDFPDRVSAEGVIKPLTHCVQGLWAPRLATAPAGDARRPFAHRPAAPRVRRGSMPTAPPSSKR